MLSFNLLCKSFLPLTTDIKLVWQKLYASKQTCQPKVSYLNYYLSTTLIANMDVNATI